MSHAGQQAANFAIATLVEHHFEDRRLFLATLDSHMLHVGESFGQVNAAVKLRDHFALDLASYLHVINLLDAVPWMSETVGQFAVVRDQDQAFGGHIESADTKYARGVRRHQVSDSRPAGRIASCCYDTDRLVHGEVCEPGLQQDFAIDPNFVLQWIDARSELGYHFSINFNATFQDQLFANAPAGDAGLRENFLEALAGLRGRILDVGGFGLRLRSAEWARCSFARDDGDAADGTEALVGPGYCARRARLREIPHDTRCGAGITVPARRPVMIPNCCRSAFPGRRISKEDVRLKPDLRDEGGA